MRRIVVICEGQTEEAFINKILVPFFADKSIYLSARIIGKPGHKGGNIKYARAITDINIILQKDRSCYCTTFFDYYGIHEDFPGKAESKKFAAICDKQNAMHTEFINNVSTDLPDVSYRFFPNIIMHEFESLLFSSPELFSKGINDTSLETMMKKILSEKAPEEINDTPNTAPSKRIVSIKKDYDKPRDGINAAMAIGLDNIRNACPLFNAWINTIESLQDEK